MAKNKANFIYYDDEGASASPAEISHDAEEKIRSFRNARLGQAALGNFHW